MKRTYISPSMEIAVVDGMTQLLAGSYTIDGEIGGGTGGDIPGRSRVIEQELDMDIELTDDLLLWD